METLQTFKYNEAPVTFKVGEMTMVNATEMAKPFGKRPNDYLALPSTNELIKAITRKSGICDNQLVTSKQGSAENGGGTWLHEDIALDFAQWLSVDFRLWCNDRIKELLRGGTQDSHGESQNVLPGSHSPQASMIGGHPVWTIPLEGELYYRLKDILNAAGIYEDKRKDTSRDWFKPHVYRINDRTGNVPHRYVRESGVLFLISRTRSAKGDSEVQRFLGSFVQKAKENRMPKAMPENPVKKGAEGIDLDKFLNIIIDIQDGETRGFLYNLYKILSRT